MPKSLCHGLNLSHRDSPSKPKLKLIGFSDFTGCSTKSIMLPITVGYLIVINQDHESHRREARNPLTKEKEKPIEKVEICPSSNFALQHRNYLGCPYRFVTFSESGEDGTQLLGRG